MSITTITDEFGNPLIWTVMFVDMVDSTEVKVRYAPQIQAISDRLVDLFEIVRQETFNRAFIAKETEASTLRFNGDGAMILYHGTEEGAAAAINAAKRIQRRLEAENLAYVEPKLQMHIRIGIASGECIGITMGPNHVEPIGRPADLAARLCAESDPDNIMIDEATVRLAGLEVDKDCFFVSRRLALKGIGDPKEGSQRFYTVSPGQLVRPVQSELFTSGLLKLYTDRETLAEEMSPKRILEHAAPGSEVYVSGRTLKAWIGNNIAVLRDSIVTKNLHVKMVLLRPDVPPYLPDEEMPAHYEDLYEARAALSRLSEEIGQADQGSLEVRETDTVIFDGTTCFTAVLAGKVRRKRLLVLQDINAASFGGKACLLLACACSTLTAKECIADGLQSRTGRVFDRAKVLSDASIDSAN